MSIRERVTYNLKDAFFPVVEEPINYGEVMGQSKRIPGYKAIVDKGSGNVLSVVSNKYRLLLNKEAYELADYIVQAVFEGKTLADFECFNLLMPKSKGSLSESQLRESERSKIECARRHFATIGESSVTYNVVTNYTDLRNVITQ